LVRSAAYVWAPWRLWSSRSSAATITTTTLVAGRSHPRTSHRLSPCVATTPSTAVPSTPASASASCRTHPRPHLHPRLGTTPRSPRRPSSSCTMGKSAAELSLSLHQDLLLRGLSFGLARHTPTRRLPAHCLFPSSRSTRSAVSHLSYHLLTGLSLWRCLCMPSQRLRHPPVAQALASLVTMILPLPRRT